MEGSWLGNETRTKIEAAAVRLLAGREHTRVELSRKLAAKGLDPGAVEPVLDDLERRKLLNDERFTEQYTAMRMRRGYGPLRIRAELRERGVAALLITAFVDDGGHDWRGLLLDVRTRKFGNHAPADRREMARQARFLTRRGFPESLVREALFDE